MSKQDSANISPLHRQLVKQRAVIVTKDPKLHLVWIHNRIFIKPLPRYIVSYAFWRDYMGGDGEDAHDIRRAALGYLRTWLYLVRYESDFRIAQDPSLHLIPPDITWDQFCRFVSDLTTIADHDVPTRYTYGEIRLTRLNFYAPFLLRKAYFQRVDYQYGTYFARFYGPVLFVIGAVSLILSGLQVAIAVDQGHPDKENNQLLSTVAFWKQPFSGSLMLPLIEVNGPSWRISFAVLDADRLLVSDHAIGSTDQMSDCYVSFKYHIGWKSTGL
ncbi:Uu.00g130480.m01.CDS01 [Anthostomella pinea]|uniref:Uu.00g130480.m01.CDS01 n=1 Tax=Anthostomella pinea TaxID=933095 RepID=A0AAI8YI61_9PEZI|nr:Uu.00g130480.m01.CDS01 [Anthostomella pinea]